MWNIEKLISKGEYTYALVINHPNATKNGYVLHHRIVKENELGRLLKKEEIVHHLNNDKKDNRPENLEVMTQEAHTRLHKTTGKNIIELICPECNISFLKEFRNTHLALKNKKRTFCSRICNGKFNNKKGKIKIRHGTRVAYNYHKCRCSKCKIFNTLSHRIYRNKINDPQLYKKNEFHK